MKKLILFLFLLPLFVSAQIQMSQVNGLIPKLNSKADSIARGTGFLKRTGLVWSYDNSTYLTTESDPTIYSWAKASTKPSYVWSEIGSRPTALSQFTNDLGNYGGWITGINSGMITAALGYSPGSVTSVATYLNSNGNDLSVATTNNTTAVRIDLSIPTASATKRGVLSSADWTNFNSKLSSISYNQPSNASYQMLWGSGNNIYGNSNITCNPYTGILSATQFSGSGAGLTGFTSSQITTALGYTPLPTRTFGTAANNNTNDFILNQNSSAQSANLWISGKIRSSIINNASFISNWNGTNWFGIGGTISTQHLIRLGMTDGEGVFQSAPGDILFQVDGAATFASTVNATGFLLNGNNLTSSLGTNYIPKWNGSNFVNSLIYDTGGAVGIGTSIIHSNFNVSGDVFFGNTSNTYGITFQQSSTSQRIFTDYYSPGVETQLILGTYSNRANQLILNTNGTVSIGSTTPSTSPTNGALVVGGGVGVGGMLSINGNNGNGISISRSGYHTYNMGINNNGFYVYDITRDDYATLIADNGNMSIGYTADQGYKLAVNGNVFASGFKTSRNSASYLLATDGSDVDASTIGVINNTQSTVLGSVSGSAVFGEPIRASAYKKILIKLVALYGSATYTIPVSFTDDPEIIFTTAGVSVTKSTTSITISTPYAISGTIILEGY